MRLQRNGSVDFGVMNGAGPLSPLFPQESRDLAATGMGNMNMPVPMRMNAGVGMIMDQADFLPLGGGNGYHHHHHHNGGTTSVMDSSQPDYENIPSLNMSSSPAALTHPWGKKTRGKTTHILEGSQTPSEKDHQP